MKGAGLRIGTVVVLLAATAMLSGCASVEETAETDTLTQHVGVYPPPPPGLPRPRVGVPPFMVTGPLAGSREALNDVAADIATTLAVNTMRFDVIERAQLDQLLREQKLEGIVRPGELAQQGQVRGVDYLLIGKITNLRVKRSATRRGFGLSRVDLPWGGGAGAVDYRKEDIRITTECGVDIRLVNPSSGSVAVAHFSDYNRTDTAKAIGLEILGASAEAEAELEITEDDKGKILRLALDDALRKMLPKVDNYLRTLNP